MDTVMDTVMEICLNNYCKSTNIVEDHHSGDVTCQSCGLVQLGRIVSELAPCKYTSQVNLSGPYSDCDPIITTSAIEKADIPKRSVRVSSLIRDVCEELELSGLAPHIFECFNSYKSQPGINTPTNTLVIAATLLIVDLKSIVISSSSICEIFLKYIPLHSYTLKMPCIEKSKQEILQYMQTHHPTRLMDIYTSNQKYLENLVRAITRRVHACLANNPWLREISQYFGLTLLRERSNEVCLEYVRLVGLICPKKKLKPLAVISVYNLLAKNIKNFNTIKKDFNDLIIAPLTDVVITNVNYWQKRLYEIVEDTK